MVNPLHDIIPLLILGILIGYGVKLAVDRYRHSRGN